MRDIALGFVLLTLLSCSTAFLTLEPVEEFSIDNFMGEWYELYRLPNKMQEGLREVITNYQLRDDGIIVVTTEGRAVVDKGRLMQFKGRGWMPEKNEPSKLKLSYSWYFTSDYWILKVDPKYEYALIGEPSGKHLWILSRYRRGDPKTVEEFKRYALILGFPVEELINSQLH